MKIRFISKLVVIFSLFAFSASGFAKPKPSWTWTKENPKPAWFTYGKEYWPEEPESGGYLKLAAARYIGLMNPNHWPVNDWNAMTYMYDFLLYNDGKYQPKAYWLAESYEYTTPKSIVMKLRKGVYYHDGAYFDAHAVKYQMDWIRNKKNGAWSRAWLEPIKSVEVIDDYTVQFNTKRIWAGFPGMMATVPGFMISPEALKKDVAYAAVGKLETKIAGANKKVVKAQAKLDKASGSKAKKAKKKLQKEQKKVVGLEKELAKMKKLIVGFTPLDKHGVGAGKYMLEEGKPGNYLKLKRNPNWWFGQSVGKPGMPYPDGVIITVIPDPSVRLANLRSGGIHSMGLTMTQYTQVKNDRRINIMKAFWPHVTALRFNTTKGPSADFRVRKAISHAIDRKALIAGIQFGQAMPAAGMYPTKHWCSNPELKPIKYDPELSKKLLAEAGYGDGLKLVGYMSNLSDSVSIGTAVKNMLQKVGVEWQFETLDAAAVDDKMKNLEYDLAEGGWAFVWEPDMMATGRYHPDGNWNQGASNNKRAIELIEKGKLEVNEAKRQKIYWELEKVLYDDYQDAWLWHPVTFTAFSKNVAGFNEKLQLDGLEGFYHSHPWWLKNGGKR
jgi:ABC-type transport system substrate-binding protein